MAVVLLLEDDLGFAASVVGALEARGHQTVWALTVAAARHVYEPDRFDVLLCDYELPDGTGLDFLAGIRGSGGATTILWSGLDRSREVAASGLHVDHVFSKSDTLEAVQAIEKAGRPMV